MKQSIKYGMIIGAVLLFGCSLLYTEQDASQIETSESQFEVVEEEVKVDVGYAETALADEIHLEVPLILQMDEPQLYNGCEVTSLAMLLNYFNVNVAKNELADKLASVPFIDEAGYYGDPNEGFVGDVYGNNEGYFVYHEPILALANQYVGENLSTIDLTGSDFEKIRYYLSQGSPIWVITTTIYEATNDIELWETASGEVEVSMNEHSVVLVGYDETSVYLNDPYGNENYQVDMASFIESWEQMGSQAITLIEN